jgi:GT2 family glycosyltransferase
MAKYFPWLLRANKGLPLRLVNPRTQNILLFDREIEPHEIKLSTSLQPEVSIIIPVYGNCNYTLKCLASIAANAPASPYEIIVVDDCSPDNTIEVLHKVSGIRLISNHENQGFIRSCNGGAKEARGEYLCFLNNDTVVLPEWLDALLTTFREFPGTGLAGSKLLYPDGTLQEAGGIIWKDGSAWNYGRNQDPDIPVYCYAREADYCSGASIMVPKKLFQDLGGFDEHYLPAYCEDSDLALKIRSEGYRVIFQPLSTVVHFEGITSGTDTNKGIKAYQVENMQKQYQRWQGLLKEYQPNGIDIDQAKDRAAKRRVLVIDHCTPTPNQDSGSIDIYNIMLFLREMGFQVTFIPEDNFLYMPKYTPALQRVGIEVLYAPYYTSVEQHVKDSGNRYDLALLLRIGVVERHLKTIKKYCPQAKVLFHTVDLHYLRLAREAELFNDADIKTTAEQMKNAELTAVSSVDATTVVSSEELKQLAELLPDKKIYCMPFSREIRGTTVKFGDRRDIVFVGGFQHKPNVDAVLYFIENVMPILRERLVGVCFYIVGSKPPEEIMRLADVDIIVKGFVEELEPLLDRMRINVAPLRYGAGIKGKIGGAMSVGLPSVATSLAVEGMSLTDNKEILVADSAEEFSEAVVRLYQDETLWNNISENGLKFAEMAWGGEAAWNKLNLILSEIGLPGERSSRPLTMYSPNPAS